MDNRFETEMPAAAAQTAAGGNAGELPYSSFAAAAEPFSAGRRELVFALLSYIAAYCYILFYSDVVNAYNNSMVWTARVMLFAVAAFVISSTEVLCRGRKRSAESMVWLGCFICCIISIYTHFAAGVMKIETPLGETDTIINWREGVWNEAEVLLFIHIFAVWWVISRSGVLSEGRSGHMLPLDALNGFIVIPFGNLFLRIRTWLYGVKEAYGSRGGRRLRLSGRGIAALAVCAVLFAAALSLLGSADSNFKALLESIGDHIHIEINETVLLRIIFSIPAGAWLWGLIGGSFRTKRERLDDQRESVLNMIASLRGVSDRLWTAVVCVFSLTYAVFFAMQASYMIGGFTGRLPEGFIYSQYAREGFFELCRVMAVNFALLWVVTRMAKAEEAGGRTLRTLCLIILAESMVFAVIALSKLILYIRVYGFTPLRLQSSWLVCTLFAGCALWAYNIVTGRPAFRKWMYFGAVTLSLLTLY